SIIAFSLTLSTTLGIHVLLLLRPYFFAFSTDSVTTFIYTLSLHDALPILITLKQTYKFIQVGEKMKLLKNLLLLISGVLVIRALLLSIDNTNDDKIDNKVSVQDKNKK